MTIGIYKLLFTDGSFYIGQSRSIEDRYKQHLSLLKGNRATNTKMQEAYDRYGSPSVSIIKECSIAELNKLEVQYINDTMANTIGLNILAGGVGYQEGESNVSSKYSKEQIVSVFKLLVNTDLLLTEIAANTGVGKHTVSDISSGRYHVWLSEEFPDEYIALLGKKNTRIAGNGKNVKNAAERGIVYPSIKDPNGVIHNITAFTSFCKSNSLNGTQLRELLNGRRETYKGWTLASESGIKS